MKKLIAIIALIAVSCLIFVGCSETPDANEPNTDSAIIGTTMAATTTTIETTTVADTTTTTIETTTTTEATATTKPTPTAKATTTTATKKTTTTTTTKVTTTTKKPTTTPMKAVNEYKWVYNNIPNGLLYELTFFDQPTEYEWVGQWNRSGWVALSSLDLPEGVTIEPDIVIQGVGYVINSGNGGGFKIKVDGKNVTIDTDHDETLVLERMEDKKMKVVSSNIDGISKGAIFIAE